MNSEAKGREINSEKLSVIIPAWNAEAYIEEAVGSVRAQDWEGGMEILVVDDGSSDASADKAEALGCRVFQKEHGGAASARNLGISRANGTFILLLDADDMLLPGALKALAAPFAAGSGAASLASDGGEILRPSGKRPETAAVFGRAVDFISPELTEEQARALVPRKESYGGVLPGCSLIRKEVFDEIGLFDETLKSGETVGWMMKLRESAFVTENIDAVTLRRRLHLSNTGRVAPRQELQNYAALLRKRMKRP